MKVKVWFRLRVLAMSMIRSVLLLLALLFGMSVCLPQEAFAQTSPDSGDVQSQKQNSAAHPALRGFSEAGMGILFGTLAGGAALLTSLYVNQTDIRPAMISAGILYPAGIAAGAILGGYLTDSQSGYWEPFVGAFVGAAVADVTAYFLAEDWPILSAILVIALPVVTTLLAMETSHAFRSHEERAVPVFPAQAPMERVVMPISLSFGF